jgi:hypothetical protein
MSYMLKPFEKQDLIDMDLRDYERHEFSFLGGGIDVFATAYMQGPGFTLMFEDKVVASAGVMVLWSGVGEAWFRGSPLIYKFGHTKKVILSSVEGFKMIKDSGFWRIQCTILKDWQPAIRYVNRLGFKYEGEMRMYGPDKRDFLRYALVDDPEE